MARHATKAPRHPLSATDKAKALVARNVHDLARVMVTEAAGLESVAGVSRNGKPIKNYAPGFALAFTPKTVTGVPERTFKFFQQPGSGYVH